MFVRALVLFSLPWMLFPIAGVAFTVPDDERIILYGQPAGSRSANGLIVLNDRSLFSYRNGQSLGSAVSEHRIASRIRARRNTVFRFRQEARKLLKAGDYHRALSRLERALALDADASIYIDLARVHYQLGNYQHSLDFLDAAEGWLRWDPIRQVEVGDLRQKALFQRAAAPAQNPRANSPSEAEMKRDAAPETESKNQKVASDALGYVFLAASIFPLFLLLRSIAWSILNPRQSPGPRPWDRLRQKRY